MKPFLTFYGENHRACLRILKRLRNFYIIILGTELSQILKNLVDLTPKLIYQSVEVLVFIDSCFLKKNENLVVFLTRV